MPGRSRFFVLTAVLALGFVVSCEKTQSPIRGVSDPTTVRIEVVAPPTIDPGSSVQLTANAIKGGAVENVTDQVQWSSTDSGVLQVTAAGVAMAVSRGEVTVSATYQQSRIASTRVMVIPSGTFRLDGKVTDGGFPVPGATLTVIAGVGEGLTARTSAAGAYVIYGVAGQVDIRATREGYSDRIETVQVGQHRSLNFEMTLAGQRINLSGAYDLTLQVLGCAEKLPEEARQRRYEATVQQDGQQLTARLSGANFVVVNNRGDRFNGSIRPDDEVAFAIGDDFFPYYYYYTTPNPGFVERLNPGNVFVVIGNVRAKGSSTSIAGTLTGTIGLVSRDEPPFWPFYARCHSDQHRFEMRRK